MTTTHFEPGCYLDGHFGWHNHYRVIDLAVEHGMELSDDDRQARDQYERSGGEDCADIMIDQGGLVDLATYYLNTLVPDGYRFEWDMGELCLWPDDDDDDSA